MRGRALMVAALWLGLSGAITVAQNTVVLRGVVTDAATGDPLRRVTIGATVGDTDVASGTSAGDGTFLLSLPARVDRVSIQASKARYATARVDLPLRAVADDVPEIRVALVRGAAISGRIVDASGSTPAALVRPTLQRVAADGTLSPAFPATATVPSPADPEGVYRFGGLGPGRYAVSFQVGWWTRAAPPTPVIVDLAAGQELEGVTIVADVRGPTGSDTAPRNGRGTIRGRVWTVEGTPVAAATVGASNKAGGWNELTDAEGRFEFDGLPPGTFIVAALKPGFRPAIVPDDRSFARVTIGSGQDTADLDLTLVRNGLISGTITDEYGDPLQNARVRVTTMAGANAGSQVAGMPPVSTDDRGRFRVADVTPGSYLVSAWAIDQLAGGVEAYVPVYYPGTRQRPFALPIDVAAGAHVDIAIALTPTLVGRISGTALTSTDSIAMGSVFLAATDDTANVADVRTAAVGPSGEFVFTGVPPGGYVIELATTAVGAGRELASDSITVTGGDHPVVLRTRPAASMTGRLRLEGAAGRSLADYSIAARRLVGSVSRSDGAHTYSGPFTDGTPFTVAELWGPTRLQFTTRDDTWYMKSIKINGVEAVDDPFDFGVDGQAFSDVEVVFSAEAASIAGRAMDERGTPAAGVAIMVFAVDPARWFAGSRWIKTARAGADGAFVLKGLPPGEYYAAALDGLDRAAAQAPEAFLHGVVAGASRVAAAPASQPNVTLRIIRR